MKAGKRQLNFGWLNCCSNVCALRMMRYDRYNGRQTEVPPVFPDAMEEACQYVEKVVNDEMLKRKRYPLEWGGEGTEGQAWRANVAAANCYEGGNENVGPHSDHLTYLGPYPTIASLSLGMCYCHLFF